MVAQWPVVSDGRMNKVIWRGRGRLVFKISNNSYYFIIVFIACRSAHCSLLRSVLLAAAANCHESFWELTNTLSLAKIHTSTLTITWWVSIPRKKKKKASFLLGVTISHLSEYILLDIILYSTLFLLLSLSLCLPPLSSFFPSLLIALS